MKGKVGFLFIFLLLILVVMIVNVKADCSSDCNSECMQQFMHCPTSNFCVTSSCICKCYSMGQNDCHRLTSQECASGYVCQNGACAGTQCTISSITITPNCINCKSGDYITVSATFSGNACPSGYNYLIKIEAESLDPIQTRCTLNSTNGDMAPMNVSCANNYCTGNWFIPEMWIPQDCLGKRVYAYNVSLYRDYYGQLTFITSTTTTIPPGFGSFNFTSVSERPCNSCGSCTSALNDANAPVNGVVKLTQNISGVRPYNHECVYMRLSPYTSNITFDCQGYMINSTGLYQYYGIYVVASNYNQDTKPRVKNCIVKNYQLAGILVEAKNTTLIENFVCNNTNKDVWNNTGSAGFGTLGINNTCDKTQGWNDNGTINCTHKCVAGCGQYTNWKTKYKDHTPCTGNLEGCVRDSDGDNKYDQYCQSNQIKPIEMIRV